MDREGREFWARHHGTTVEQVDEARRDFMDRLIERAARFEGEDFMARWMPLDEGYRARFRERYGLDREQWERLMLWAPRTTRNWARMARAMGMPTRRLMAAMWAARVVREAVLR